MLEALLLLIPIGLGFAFEYYLVVIGDDKKFVPVLAFGPAPLGLVYLWNKTGLNHLSFSDFLSTTHLTIIFIVFVLYDLFHLGWLMVWIYKKWSLSSKRMARLKERENQAMAKKERKELIRKTKEIRKTSGKIEKDIKRYHKLQEKYPYEEESLQKCTFMLDLLDKVDKGSSNNLKPELKKYAEIQTEKKQIRNNVERIANLYSGIGNEEAARALLDRLNDRTVLKHSTLSNHRESGNREAARTLIDKLNDRTVMKRSILRKNLDIGNTIKFGAYPTGNGEEKVPIEWIVLDVKNGKALLLSKYVLDFKKYNNSYTSVTWENCSLRKWLNGSFINKAFSTNDQSIILSTDVKADKNPKFNTDPGVSTTDKVFLLSVNEANMFFSSNAERACKPTKAAMANRLHDSDNGNCRWVLRTPGKFSYYATGVRVDGSVYDNGFEVDIKRGIRPAIWVKTDS